MICGNVHITIPCLSLTIILLGRILADRTNGRAYATMLRRCVRPSACGRLSSVCNVMYIGRLNGASYSKKLLLTSYWKVVYEKSIGTKMNDLDLCLEVV